MCSMQPDRGAIWAALEKEGWTKARENRMVYRFPPGVTRANGFWSNGDGNLRAGVKYYYAKWAGVYKHFDLGMPRTKPKTRQK